ncbi:MAG: N-acetylmuramoyl-L-alanine amidase, partial [Gemmatimonadota bacterium]|nr:N-acetylmuramoyl-L-alanine amidase [Gemmatimonadota bacterium]
MISLRASLLAMTALVLTACGGDRRATAPVCLAPATSSVPAPAAPAVSPYDSIFTAVGAEFGVPAALLRSIGYVETRWQMVRGEEEFAGLPAAHGVMALRGERLRHGAELAGVTQNAARTDATANIRAAAALLSVEAKTLGIDRAEISDWDAAVARFSGIDGEAGQASYLGDVSAARGVRRSALARSAVVPCKTDP